MTTITTSWQGRVDAVDWDTVRGELDSYGCALTGPLLSPGEAADIASLYPEVSRFRSTVDMARHRFGLGRYRYFDHPLPPPIPALRTAFYRHLAPIANDWSRLLRGDNPTFPAELEQLLERCHAAGQRRATPLILRYRAGDWNALHQDLYGEVYFPFQVVTILARPGHDFTGGQFVLLEQRPRAQSRAHVVEPARGAFVIFPTRERPSRGRSGYHRVGLRHGVATVTWGERTALGVIFHDAR